jgi:hypothetical protein
MNEHLSKHGSYRENIASGSVTVENSIFLSIKTIAYDTRLDKVAEVMMGNRI